jgi:hypothetical protein
MKLYTYIVTHDTGFAPNPFGEYCTLANCTPNHMGIRADADDWICGFSGKADGHRLVYALQVDERIRQDEYFRDSRFEDKKPADDPPERRCGDNFYELREGKGWKQHRNHYHNGDEHLKQDTRSPYVFVGKRFWYFGAERIHLPADIRLNVGGRGVRLSHRERSVERFVRWLEGNHRPGRHGMPLHFDAGCGQSPKGKKPKPRSKHPTC